MQSKVSIIVVCLCGASVLCAQTNPPPAQPTPPPASSTSTSTSPGQRSGVSYVRRFSAGLTLSVLGLSTVGSGTSTVNTSSMVTTGYSTKGASSRIGYGATAQASLTDHFALSAGVFLHKIGYQLMTSVNTTTNVLEGGIVVPITTTTSSHEDTRGRLIDVPLVLRFYGKNRHTPGPRWFFEGGGAYRDATNLRTSLDTTDASGVNTCCKSAPTQAAHKNSRGFVAGAGIQLIDPFGIRVIPEVRYTRWVNEIFSAFSTHTQKNQVEASLTLSF